MNQNIPLHQGISSTCQQKFMYSCRNIQFEVEEEIIFLEKCQSF